jgi:hypothetical protein
MPFTKPLIKRISVSLKCISFFILWQLTSINSKAQSSKWVIENYNYLGQQGSGVVVPILHFETKRNWYAELRYNYEDNQTLSFFGGKTFKGGNNFGYSITPLTGFSIGRFTGFSIGINSDLEWKGFYVSSQTQQSFGTKKENVDFFFSWSELGYNVTESFFAGVAMQYTRQLDYKSFEPGFVAGLAIKNFTFPVYVFSPFSTGCYFVVGVNYEYYLQKKKKN